MVRIITQPSYDLLGSKTIELLLIWMLMLMPFPPRILGNTGMTCFMSFLLEPTMNSRDVAMIQV